MVRWTLGIVAAAAVLVALALGFTTRSLGLDVVALRRANEELLQEIARRDESIAALEREVDRLRGVADGLESRQAPEIVSVVPDPAPDADGVVEAGRIQVHVAANGPATHVMLLFHPEGSGLAAPAGAAPEPGTPAALPPSPGRPAEGVPPSPVYVVDIARDGQDGWVLAWDIPPGAAGSLYVEACSGPRCSLASAAVAEVRGTAP